MLAGYTSSILENSVSHSGNRAINCSAFKEKFKLLSESSNFTDIRQPDYSIHIIAEDVSLWKYQYPDKKGT